MFKVPEQFRLTTGPMASDRSWGNRGAFVIDIALFPDRVLACLVSDDSGWEHVAVTVMNSVPTTEELEFVARLFWDEDEDDDVIQVYHRKQTLPSTRHLWRNAGASTQLPPPHLFGDW